MLELDSYQEIIETIHEKQATFVSISPENVDIIKEVYKNKQYDFHILSDINNEYARSLGIVFELEENLSQLYKGFGIDLVKTQGNENDELPIPVTIVINRNGLVEHFHFDTDYTKRFEPEDSLLYI